MKPGKIINPGPTNDHLEAPYVRVYFNGSVDDWLTAKSIPLDQKTYDKIEPPRHVQSPTLVRLTYYRERWGEPVS